MKLARIFILLSLMYSFNGCKTDSSKEINTTSEQWFKGNLHTHSYWSDGDEFPEVILNWYKSNGYQFAALSDHNILAQGEKWTDIAADTLYQNAFDHYLQEYGEDWVTYKKDAGQTYVKLKTYQEYKKLIEEQGRFIVIQGEEITDRYEDKLLHMNASNIQQEIAPQGGASVSDVLQNNLDQVLEQRRRTGVPILPHINHPNFFYSISLQDMYKLNGARFFEVYNGHPMVHNMGDSTHVSTEDMWDMINISYLEQNKPLMFGLATDDSHHYHKKGKQWSNAGRGWIMVKTDTLAAAAIINALEKGDFYSSTGVTLKSLQTKDNVLSVAVKDEPGIHYTINFIGLEKGKSETSVLKTVTGSAGKFELTDDVVFVRCKITSSKKQQNPIEDIIHQMAWTQPIMGNKN